MKRHSNQRHIVLIALAFSIAAAAVAGTVHAGEKPVFDLYGFVRFDLMYFDSQMQNDLVPMWVKNEYDGSVKMDDPAFIMHPRLTRIGMRFKGWKINEKWKADVGVEVDFQEFASRSESRQSVRMRLGYIRLHRDYWQIMGGQHWDLISPLFPNINLNAVNWNAGNLGDRRPQFRVTFAPQLADGGTVYFAGALALQGAVNMADIDKNGIPDGQDATFPQLQGRFGVKQPVGESVEFRMGVWGHIGQEELYESDTTTVKIEYDSWSAGADFWMTVGKKVKILGELWTGENLPDLRGGIAQGIDDANRIEIGASGGWGEFDYIASDKTTLIAGYSIDNPRDEDLKHDNMRSKNQMAYGAVRWKPWAGEFMLTLEYMRWWTDFTGFDETSTSNHVDVNMMYFF